MKLNTAQRNFLVEEFRGKLQTAVNKVSKIPKLEITITMPVHLKLSTSSWDRDKIHVGTEIALADALKHAKADQRKLINDMKAASTKAAAAEKKATKLLHSFKTALLFEQGDLTAVDALMASLLKELEK